MSTKKISQTVDEICTNGCDSVNDIIKTLSSGKKLEITNDFSDAEKNELLNELKSIMSVYENKDSKS